MCIKIKLSDNNSHITSDVLRANFPTKQFSSCPFLRLENENTTWLNKVVARFSIPVRGYTERMLNGSLKDFEQAGKLLIFEVRSPLDGSNELRIVTRKSENGSLHGREPVIEQSYASASSE
jgi:hypothetical protein